MNITKTTSHNERFTSSYILFRTNVLQSPKRYLNPTSITLLNNSKRTLGQHDAHLIFRLKDVYYPALISTGSR